MVRRVVEILKNFDPQLVPTAYHFFTSNAIRTLGIPCISIDHQHSLTKHELNIPGEQSFSRLLFQIPLRYMYGKADLHFVSSLFPLSPVSPAEDVGVENISAFFCGFKTVRLFEKKNIEHIRTPWANGPATAAWLTSKLTGILFRFMGRARDIYALDDALREKICDSSSVRINPKVNIKHMQGVAGGDCGKIHLGYDPYPISRFRQAPVPMKPPCLVLVLGCFVGIKGGDVVFGAARILEDAGLDFHIAMTGAGRMGWRLGFLCRTLRLGQRGSFPGFATHDRVSGLLCTADLFVMPSVLPANGERDSMLNVVVEALLHRLPVVATDAAGRSEVIQDGKKVYLVPQEDPRALASAMRRMVWDRENALVMAANGRELVVEHFDPNRRHGQFAEAVPGSGETGSDRYRIQRLGFIREVIA